MLQLTEGERMSLFVFQVTVIIVGVVGNFLIIVILKKHNETADSSSSVFVVNLAVCDLIACINLSVVVKVLVEGEWIFGKEACHLEAYSFSFIETVKIQALTIVCVDRYVILRGPQSRFSFIRKRGYRFFFVAFSWIFPGILLSGPFFGWSRFKYYPSLLMCSYEVDSSYSYAVFTTLTGFSIQTGTTTYCGFRVMSTLYKYSKRKIAPEKTNVANNKECERNHNGAHDKHLDVIEEVLECKSNDDHDSVLHVREEILAAHKMTSSDLSIDHDPTEKQSRIHQHTATPSIPEQHINDPNLLSTSAEGEISLSKQAQFKGLSQRNLYFKLDAGLQRNGRISTKTTDGELKQAKELTIENLQVYHSKINPELRKPRGNVSTSTSTAMVKVKRTPVDPKGNLAFKAHRKLKENSIGEHFSLQNLQNNGKSHRGKEVVTNQSFAVKFTKNRIKPQTGMGAGNPLEIIHLERQQKLQRRENLWLNTKSNGRNTEQDQFHHQKLPLIYENRRERSLALMVGVTILLFYLAYTPTVIVLLATELYLVPKQITILIFQFMFASHAMQVIVYLVTNPTFRNDLKKHCLYR